MTRRTLLGAAAAAGAVSSAQAQTPGGEFTANAYMHGFPPADAARVDPSNWHMYPQVKWSVSHMRELFASRDAMPVARRPISLRESLQTISGFGILVRRLSKQLRISDAMAADRRIRNYWTGWRAS